MMLIWYMMVIWYFGLSGVHGGPRFLETIFSWEYVWYAALAWYLMALMNYFGLPGMVWLPGM